MPYLELQNVHKVIKGSLIVDRLSLEVAEREFLVILGPSGCGKSTTLNMIAGLEEPTDGEIFIKGRRVTHLPPKDRRIAMVFQNYALYPHMTVARNLGFGLKMAGMPAPEIELKVSAIARVLGIEPLLHRRPRELSGGQRQRVAVGRAMVRDPDLFLFDEPLSNLDAQLRGRMRVELKQLHERAGATTIYVTHDQTEAMTMASRIVVMRSGVIQQIGVPLEIYDRPHNRFVAEFVGSPTMNLISCSIGREAGVVHASGPVFRLALSNSHTMALDAANTASIVLGIRPEDIVLDPTGERTTDHDMLTAEVVAIEPLGNATYVSLRVGTDLLTAVTSPEIRHRVHDVLPMRFDMAKVHLFAGDGAGGALRLS